MFLSKFTNILTSWVMISISCFSQYHSLATRIMVVFIHKTVRSPFSSTDLVKGSVIWLYVIGDTGDMVLSLLFHKMFHCYCINSPLLTQLPRSVYEKFPVSFF